MKEGRTLTELASEIERQNAVKKDYLADTRKMEIVLTDNSPQLAVPDKGLTLALNSVAHRQIGEHTGIPAKYYDKMQSNLPELLADNVNAWFKNQPEVRMIRTLDGTARAFLSKKYRRLDNFEVMKAVLPILGQIQDVQFPSTQLTENRMYIKAVNPRLQAEVQKGDIVQAGIMITNSETGMGSVCVQPLIYRLVCLNGMVVNDAATRRYHVGRENTANENYELYSDDTIRADDHAFILKMQDTVKAAVDEARFSQVIDQMREAAEAKITGDIPEVVELTSRELKFTKDESSGILNHLIRDGDFSLYGLANAVTKHSQEVASYDRATDLEAAGYSVLTMNPKLWNRINAEAAKR